VRRLWLSLGLLVTVLCVAGGLLVVGIPRNGGPLEDGERKELLYRAGLPGDFPVHPDARRMSQPKQGGFSYALDAPVPDAVAWERASLERAGYQVFSGELEGQDEYLPRILFFKSSAGSGGFVIVRQNGRGAFAPTEVKVLSEADERLQPAPLPTVARSGR
jgi:hypothetical protein